MKAKKHSMSRSVLYRLLICFTLAIVALIAIDIKIRPIVKRVFAHQCRTYVIAAINNSVLRTLSELEVKYSNIVNLRFGDDGFVVSAETDTMTVNGLKAQLVNAVNNELSDIRGNDIEISLGTISGVQLLNGKGPTVKVKVFPMSTAEAYFTSEFTSAGVNQTLHRITLTVTGGVTAAAPGYIVSSEVKTEFLIADTVIVGRIPESYTYISGDNRDIISKNNDYSH